MTWEEITEAVDTGKKVYWSNAGYIVKKDSEGYFVKYCPNGMMFRIYKENFHVENTDLYFVG